MQTETFLNLFFSKKSLFLFFLYNILPCLVFFTPLLLVQLFYPTKRPARERFIVSFVLTVAVFSLFCYPTSFYFTVTALLNLLFPLALLTLYAGFRWYPATNPLEKKIVRGYLVLISCFSIAILSYLLITSYAEDPKHFDVLIFTTLFTQLGLLLLFFSVPVLGTLWLLKDLARKREANRSARKKRFQMKNDRRQKRSVY